MDPGEIFNAPGVFAGTPNPVTIMALECSSLWIVPEENLDQLQARHPTLARAIARSLNKRVLALMEPTHDRMDPLDTHDLLYVSQVEH